MQGQWLEQCRSSKLREEGCVAWLMVLLGSPGCLQRLIHWRGSLSRGEQALAAVPSMLFFLGRLVRDLRRAKAAVILQKNIKMALARRSYLRIHVAIITIQAFTRGMFARHLYRVVRVPSGPRGWEVGCGACSVWGRWRSLVLGAQGCCSWTWTPKGDQSLR